MGEKIKAKAVKTSNDLWKAAQVVGALIVSVGITRSSILTWYNNESFGLLPFDRIAAGLGLALVLSYFIWLHYKK